MVAATAAATDIICIFSISNICYFPLDLYVPIWDRIASVSVQINSSGWSFHVGLFHGIIIHMAEPFKPLSVLKDDVAHLECWFDSKNSLFTVQGQPDFDVPRVN